MVGVMARTTRILCSVILLLLCGYVAPDRQDTRLHNGGSDGELAFVWTRQKGNPARLMTGFPFLLFLLMTNCIIGIYHLTVIFRISA